MLYFTSAFDINYCHVNFDETVLPQCRQRTAGDSNVNMYCIYLVQYQGEPGEAHILTGHTITSTLSLSSHWDNVYTLDKYSVHPFIQIKYFAIFCLQLSFLTLPAYTNKQYLYMPGKDFKANRILHAALGLTLWDLSNRKAEIVSQ